MGKQPSLITSSSVCLCFSPSHSPHPSLLPSILLFPSLFNSFLSLILSLFPPSVFLLPLVPFSHSISLSSSLLLFPSPSCSSSRSPSPFRSPLYLALPFPLPFPSSLASHSEGVKDAIRKWRWASPREIGWRLYLGGDELFTG